MSVFHVHRWLVRRRDQGRNRRPRQVCRPSCEALDDRVVPSAGVLDPTFGTNGFTTIPDPGDATQVVAVAVQPDGKVVAAGTAVTPTGSDLFIVARYLSNGTLDPTFGTNGVVKGPAGIASAVGVTSTGLIYVAGNTGTSSSGDLEVARFTATGAADAAFGTAGVVTTQVTGHDYVTSLAIQPDGKVIVGGGYQMPMGPGQGAEILRYNTDGSQDTTFANGITTLNATRASIALQPDGKIVYTGHSGGPLPAGGIEVGRLNANGSPDTTFGPSTPFPVDVGYYTDGGTAVAVQPDGKILVGGDCGGHSVIVRLTATGSLDTSFATSGKRFGSYPLTGVTALRLEPNGQIVVLEASSISNPSPTELARYNPDGSLDTQFGTNGMAPITQGYWLPGALAVQPDGNILVAGTPFGIAPPPGALNGLARYQSIPTPVTGTANQQFVTRLYPDLLGRAVDANGLAYWSGQLDQGKISQQGVVAALEQTTEYQQHVVATLYADLLGRLPDSGGLASWTSFLASGGTGEQLAVKLLTSGEYFNHWGGSNGTWLDALYRDVLHRSMSSSEEQYWISVLNSGQGFAGVASAIVSSTEASTVEVQALYHQFLHRAPDPSGAAWGTSFLLGGGTPGQFIVPLAGSNEYYHRTS